MKPTFALILVSSLVAGCASTDLAPNADAAFGDAVRHNVAAQTLDPAAGRKSAPVVGIDATAGTLAMERYHDSFKAPPQTFNVINIGGAINSAN